MQNETKQDHDQLATSAPSEPAELSDEQIDTALNALVAEGETARWYIEQAFQSDDEVTRRLMVQEVGRAMLAAAAGPQPAPAVPAAARANCSVCSGAGIELDAGDDGRAIVIPCSGCSAPSAAPVVRIFDDRPMLADLAKAEHAMRNPPKLVFEDECAQPDEAFDSELLAPTPEMEAVLLELDATRQQLASAEARLAAQPEAPAEPSAWDGKLHDTLQRALNDLRLEVLPSVANAVEHEVRDSFRALWRTNEVLRRMYRAAQDRCDAFDAAQPNPFAPPAAVVPAELTVAAQLYQWLRSNRSQRDPDTGHEIDVFDEDGSLLYDDDLDSAIKRAILAKSKEKSHAA